MINEFFNFLHMYESNIPKEPMYYVTATIQGQQFVQSS